MKKMKKLVLMLCLVLSGAWCYANGAAGTGNKKGDGPFELDAAAELTLMVHECPN